MGLYAFFSFAGIAVVALAAGRAADRLIPRGRDAMLVRQAFAIAGIFVASSVVLSARAKSIDAALFCNIASLCGLGLATANYNALCRLTLIPASNVGLVIGFRQIATALAGIVAPVLTGRLLQAIGSYTLPIDAIFPFLVMGALTTALALRRRWSLRLEDRQFRPVELQRQPSGGDVPWSFTAPGGRWMLVANQNSGSVAVFRIDLGTGLLTATGEAMVVEHPVSIAFSQL